MGINMQLTQDRRTQNLQAIEWQNRDLLKEISELREAMNQILILPVDNIDEVYIIAGNALKPKDV
jgi:hypothetical protein